MIVTTGIGVDGREVSEYLGVVRGIVVRATGIGRGIVWTYSGYIDAPLTLR